MGCNCLGQALFEKGCYTQRPASDVKNPEIDLYTAAVIPSNALPMSKRFEI
jgi:hypothetical protein